ncbi:MAG: glycosyltransferase, partial [Candidatus Azambacteria bacterium]|nr:glycosyltransferase [Candidatus Azambacteria bacterium]
MAKKILFLITKSEMGGAQRFLYDFITHLNPNNYEILVAAGGSGELLEKLKKKNIQTALIKNFSNIPGLKNILAFFEILFLIKNFKPDILYLLSSEAGFSGAIAGSLYRLLSRKKIKIIYRIGGWAFKEPRNIAIKKIYLLAEKISAPFKDVIITNSEFDRQLAIKNKIAKAEKIVTIYNGLDFGNLNFLPKKEAQNFLGLTGNIIVGTIANLYKNKGLEYLIYAAAKIKNPELKFIVIGDGPEKENLKQLIGEIHLENSVFLTGYIDNAYQYLKAFDIFTLPSVKEGQPWTILEAMAADVPIVATNIAGIPEMLENEKSGLLVEPA